MKEHNPQNPILEMSVNGTPTPVKTPKEKKRDHSTMIDVSGFQGDSSGSRAFPIPRPSLERDFQMSLQLNPNISVGPSIWGQRNWVSFISGHWNGRWGKGTVVVCSEQCLPSSYMLTRSSLAVRRNKWLRQICPLISTPTTCSKRTIIHLRTSSYARKDGGLAPAIYSRS